ncbi:MAG: flavin reductase family protein [Pseudomonadota bacterium]|nr:flavin reductase family protein [Pseudomonadota bacterium]
MTVSPRELRDTMGMFATGVTIITAVDGEGRPVGLTANSFNSVSLDPPLVLFSLDHRANCAAAFARGQPFAVNILGADQEAQSNHFASKSEDKFADSAFDWAPGENGCALIAGAIATLECAVESVHEGGDHWIIVGRVSRVVRAEEPDPLLFWRGRYLRIAGS